MMRKERYTFAFHDYLHFGVQKDGILHLNVKVRCSTVCLREKCVRNGINLCVIGARCRNDATEAWAQKLQYQSAIFEN